MLFAAALRTPAIIVPAPPEGESALCEGLSAASPLTLIVNKKRSPIIQDRDFEPDFVVGYQDVWIGCHIEAGKTVKER